jgi:hypothetical protein
MLHLGILEKEIKCFSTRNKGTHKNNKSRPSWRIGVSSRANLLGPWACNSMKLPFIWSPRQGSGSWWHSQDKGGLITSQPCLFCEVLVGNLVTTGHHIRAMSPN